MSRGRIIYFGFCLVLAVLIFWRYQAIKSEISQARGTIAGLAGQELILTGRVIKEPDIRENNIKLTIALSLKTDACQFLGKILITTARYPEYQYGDELEIIGQLEAPAIFDDFNYKNYLLKDGIYSVIYYPEIKLLSRRSYPDTFSYFYSGILTVKNRLREIVGQNFSPPQSSIIGAMILGDKNQMLDKLKEKLNIAGIRHITAVSGMHILILSSILTSFLLWLGFWRNQIFYLALIIVWSFIAMTGFQPSAVRAGMMGSLLLIGQKIGRESTGSRAMAIAAGIMLMINPLLLFYDAGFQLSFLAVMGIIYLRAFFKRLLKIDIMAVTLSAYVFTLPIIIYNFGRASLVAPLTNLLIIPVVYPIMVLGLVFVLAGLIFPFLAGILSLPLWLLLTYIIKTTDLFSGSWAVAAVKNIHWFWPMLYYLFLALIIWHLKKKNLTRSAGWLK